MKLKTICLTAALALGSAATQAQSASPDGAFVVKPYLQIGRQVAATSLQVLWHGADDAASWSVEWRASARDAWHHTDTPTATRVAVGSVRARLVWRAALSGLVPGSTFNYRILRNGQSVFEAEALAPKSAQQPFRFVAFGDVGAGTAEQKAMANRAFVAKPDLVVVPGDIVYEYGLVSEYDKNFWPIYNADNIGATGVPLIRSVPMVTVPGNHDIDNRNLDKYPDGLAYYFFWDQPLNGPTGVEGGPIVPTLLANDTNRKAFLQAAGDAYPRMANYSFDYGNTHWTVLDSNPYVDWTDKALVEWVAHDLAAAKDATWRFVTFHHPGFNSSNEHLEQQHMRLLSPVMEAGRVDVVFSGHLHNYQRSFPLSFVPIKKGTLLMGGRDGKTVRGRVVPGRWTLDKSYDGVKHTQPKGIIYIVTGAGGKELYNVEQHNDPDSWQKFTDKFISNQHTLTIADVNGRTLTVRQVNAEGQELDKFVVTK